MNYTEPKKIEKLNGNFSMLNDKLTLMRIEIGEKIVIKENYKESRRIKNITKMVLKKRIKKKRN